MFDHGAASRAERMRADRRLCLPSRRCLTRTILSPPPAAAAHAAASLCIPSLQGARMHGRSRTRSLMGLGSLLTALVAMAIAAGVAAADTPATAFDYDTTWKALVNEFPSDQAWLQPGFDDSSWNDDQAPFGNGRTNGT